MHDNNLLSDGSNNDALLMANLLRNQHFSGSGGGSNRLNRFFCHNCRRMFYTPNRGDDDASEIACGHCGSGFVEEMASRLVSPRLGLHALTQQGDLC